jgi:hypothetical protein
MIFRAENRQSPNQNIYPAHSPPQPPFPRPPVQAQRLFQEPPAKSKFLAANDVRRAITRINIQPHELMKTFTHRSWTLNLLRLTSGIFLFGIVTIHGGQIVKEGDKIDNLETKSGRIYEAVTVRGVTPAGLLIIHKHGAAKLPAAELPQYAQMFNVVEDPVIKNTPAPDTEGTTEPMEIWTPSSVDDVMDCSLLVKIAKNVDKDGNTGAGGASAFLVNHGKTTYIYSNVHNFDGTSKFEIVDRHGTIYKDFVSVEVTADGYGFFEAKRWGGDILRIRLSQYREKALMIDPEVLTASNGDGRKIVVTGNTQARGVITRLEGVIRNIDEYGVIHHTAATEAGNSGSPIVDLATFKVVGILTWGSLDTRKPLDQIWLKANPDPATRISKACGAGLANVQYVPCSFDKLYLQRLAVNDLKKAARLMGLMDTLIPTKQGLFLNKQAIVMGEYNVKEIFDESLENPVLTELVALSEWLSKRGESKIGISNQDMLKVYIQSYQRCLSHIQRQRMQTVKPEELTFYMKCILKNTRALDICIAYENATARSIEWYTRQKGTRGQALPLTQRLRLPTFTDGISALGLGEE